MRVLFSFIAMVIILGCSNFYPILLTTPVKDDIVDTIIRDDTLDIVGNYLSRDTIFGGAMNLNAGFDKIINFTIIDDSAITLFFKIDAVTKMGFVLQNSQKQSIPFDLVESDNKIHIESKNITKLTYDLFIKDVKTTFENVLVRFYIEKKDTVKYSNPNFVQLNRIFNRRVLSKNRNQTIDSTGKRIEFNVITNDSIKGVVECDSNLRVFIVDEENYFNYLFDSEVSYIYNKQKPNDTLAIRVDNTQTLYYIVDNIIDTLLSINDSVVIVRD